MNILSKLNQAIQVTDQMETEASDLVSIHSHIRSVRHRSLPNFVVYSSRRVRSQLNG